MGVPELATRPDPTRASRSGHVAGAAVGIGFAVVIEAVTVAEPRLHGVFAREAAFWPILAITGMFLLLGAVTAVAVLLAPRLPWIPTAAAALLGYGTLASLPTRVADVLPHPGLGLPRADWGLSTLALLAGAMLIAAVWGWRSYRRHDADAGGESSSGGSRP